MALNTEESASARTRARRLLHDGNWTVAAQPPASETPQRRGATIGQDDLVGVSSERLADDDLIGSATREDDDVKVNVVVAFDGESRSRQVLAGEVPRDLVPEHRPGVAAALGLRLLRNQPHRCDPAAPLGRRLGEVAKRGIGAVARPVHD